MNRSFVLCAYHGVLRAVTGLYPKVPVTEEQLAQFRDAYSITPEENKLVVFRVMLEWLKAWDTKQTHSESIHRTSKAESLQRVHWLGDYAQFSAEERRAIVLHALLKSFTREYNDLPVLLVEEIIDREIGILVRSEFDRYYASPGSDAGDMQLGSLGSQLRLALIERDMRRLPASTFDYLNADCRSLFCYTLLVQETA